MRRSLEDTENQEDAAIKRSTSPRQSSQAVQKLIADTPEGKPERPKRRRLRLRWRKKSRQSSLQADSPAGPHDESLPEWMRRLQCDTLQPRTTGAMKRFRTPLELNQALEAEAKLKQLQPSPTPCVNDRPLLVPSRMCPDNLRFFSVQPFSLKEKIRRWANITNFFEPETPPEHVGRDRLDSVVPLPVMGRPRTETGTSSLRRQDSPTLDRSVSQRAVKKPQRMSSSRRLELIPPDEEVSPPEEAPAQELQEALPVVAEEAGCNVELEERSEVCSGRKSKV